MNLLVLDGPRDPRPGTNPLYRGTYRAHPTHCETAPDDDEINRLFFWFLEEGGELGVVKDPLRALRFAELWNKRLVAGRFEVLEATESSARPESDGHFIGYDLSAAYNNSLLVSGLRSLESINLLPLPVREMLDLLNRHYAPQLNAQGLFQSIEVACLCLRSMVALQVLHPNLFEGGDLRDFQPVGLYRVTSAPHIH